MKGSFRWRKAFQATEAGQQQVHGNIGIPDKFHQLGNFRSQCGIFYLVRRSLSDVGIEDILSTFTDLFFIRQIFVLLYR